MRSLRTKLVLYISVLVAGLVAASGFFEVRRRSAEMNTELGENARNFAAISANTVLDRTQALYYQADKFPELESAVRQVMVRHRALTRVEVVETLFGVVLFDSREFEEGYYGFKRAARVFDNPDLLKDLELGRLVVEPRQDQVRVVVPLFAGREIVDPRDINRAVVFDFSTAYIVQALAAMRNRYALQAVLFVLIGVLLAALESQAITRPLRRLTEGVQRIAQGDLEHRVAVTSRDELGALGVNFNTMAGSLKQSRDDLLRAMQRLEVQNEELRQLDRLKDQFIANTSHELRTPINGILGLISAVLDGADGPLNPRQAAHLRMVHESGERLKNLIANILDFSKLKAGRERFEFAAFRLGDLATHLAALGEGLLRGKPVTIAVELPDSLPAVWGDHERVMQILVNLVGNAAKFTAKGHVRVFAEAKNGQVAVSVEDTGAGIPPEARTYLFQEFRQVDGSASRSFEGTGLGLAISKQLVEAHGGRIDFKSEVDQGTTFTFTLPTRPGAAAAATAPVVAAPAAAFPAPAPAFATGVIGRTGAAFGRADLTQLRGGGEILLVVDDEPANVEALRVTLSETGYGVLTASSAAEALELLGQQKVALVLADVRMPQMTGLDLCRRIKTLPGHATTPVFLVTAQADTAADLHAASEVGADAYVVKPFEPATLLERIHDVLKPNPQTPRGKGERVLVVDDRAIAAEGLAEHLRAYGYEPVAITDPATVLAQAAREKPDLAVIDVRMGEVTGFELCRQLRSDARFSRLPVILVSGFAGPTERLRAQEVGAQEFVAKPFALDEFLGKVAFHLRGRAAEGTRQGRGEKVLVVDDIPVNVEALATQLEYRGYAPLRALSGQQALTLAKAEKPQAVISDVMMPGMTGYDLCRELAQDAALRSPPVILLTAKSGTLQDKLLGFDAGAVDYVVKPFEAEELMARLAKVLKRVAQPAEAAAPSHTGVTRVVETAYAVDAEAPTGVDVRGAGEAILCVDDNPINLEVLKTHLERVNYRAVLAPDGAEALERLEQTAVDLILLDVMMPRMHGYEFLKRLRANPKHKDIPVVVVSAKDRVEDSLTGFRMGVVDYVTKPFNPPLVAAKVAAILALRRAQAALSTIGAELNVARLIQQASFPQGSLDLPGASLRGFVQCAETSGGDWYGYYLSPDQDRLSLVAGDVTGHGVSAALVALASNSIKTTIELVDEMVNASQSAPAVLAALEGRVPDGVRAGFARLLEVPHSPSAFASLVNAVFCQSKSFLRMTASVLDLHVPTGELRYTLAAAPKPFWLKRAASGKGFDAGALMAPPGPLLGQDREAKYTDQKVTLQPGEAVLLYSDGVTEAVGPESQQFGNRRVVQALRRTLVEGEAPSAVALRDALVGDLFKFTGDLPLQDDVTVVVLQRTAA